MQITLDQSEIFDALETYVRDRISIKKSQTVEIDLKAGRGENGYSATIDIISGTNKTPAASASSSKTVLDEIEEDMSTGQAEEPEEEDEEVEEEDAAPKPIIFG